MAWTAKLVPGISRVRLEHRQLLCFGVIAANERIWAVSEGMSGVWQVAWQLASIDWVQTSSGRNRLGLVQYWCSIGVVCLVVGLGLLLH